MKKGNQLLHLFRNVSRTNYISRTNLRATLSSTILVVFFQDVFNWIVRIISIHNVKNASEKKVNHLNINDSSGSKFNKIKNSILKSKICDKTLLTAQV